MRNVVFSIIFLLLPVAGFPLFCSCHNQIGGIMVSYYWWQENNTMCGDMYYSIPSMGGWYEVTTSGGHTIGEGEIPISAIECDISVILV